jgi:uncharacterized lipoprotein YmbA
MSSNRPIWILLAAGLAGALILAGCGKPSPPSRFYSFSTLPVQGDRQVNDASRIVRVGPVELPASLDRPQIVTRTGPHTVVISETHRWAGPLHETIGQTIVENLTALMTSDFVTGFPGESFLSNRTYRVPVNVRRFEAWPGDKVLLECDWSIRTEQTRKILYNELSIVEAPVAGAEYQHLIDAQSKVLEDLSRQIAEAFETIER